MDIFRKRKLKTLISSLVNFSTISSKSLGSTPGRASNRLKLTKNTKKPSMCTSIFPLTIWWTWWKNIQITWVWGCPVKKWCIKLWEPVFLWRKKSNFGFMNFLIYRTMGLLTYSMCSRGQKWIKRLQVRRKKWNDQIW